MKKQKEEDQIFTFSRYNHAYFDKNDKFAKGFFLDKMIKKGYLVKNLRERVVKIVEAELAWARKKGIDKKERWKLQEEINNMKEPKVIKILK